MATECAGRARRRSAAAAPSSATPAGARASSTPSSSAATGSSSRPARGRVHERARRAVVGGADPQGRQLRAGGADAAGPVGQLAWLTATHAHGHDHDGHGHAGHAHCTATARDADRGALRTALVLIAASWSPSSSPACSPARWRCSPTPPTCSPTPPRWRLAARREPRRAPGPGRDDLRARPGRDPLRPGQRGHAADPRTLIIVDGDQPPGLRTPRRRRAGARRGAGRRRGQPRRRPGPRRRPDAERSLNVEGSYRHILTDLFGFVATAIAAVVILATGFDRADAIASLLIAALMLHAAYGLLLASGRVFMEAAPAGPGPGGDRPRAGRAARASSRFTTSTCGRSPRASPRSRPTSWSRAGDDCHERRRSCRRWSASASASTTRRSRSTTRRPISHRCRSRSRPASGVRLDAMKLVKPGEDHEVPRGVVGGAEISQATAGAHNIYMGRFRVPAGARSLPHYHEGCESALYMLERGHRHPLGRPSGEGAAGSSPGTWSTCPRA